MTVVVFLSSLLGFMTLGMPIAFALLLTGSVLMWYLDFWDVQLLAQNLQAGADSFPLLAVPFFILAGELMNAGGISRRIIAMAQAYFGHKRGGLGYVAIAASVLLASMSGSALADTAALATLLLPMMRERGYPLSSSSGLVAAGGIIAPIIPPSMPFVIYGVVTGTSISQLFLAGMVPGLIMGMGLIVAWTLIARRIDEPKQEKASGAVRRRVLVDGAAALMLPVIIVGGLRGGLFTPTEAAVVAAVYALAVSTLLYRELTWAGLVEVLTRASRTTASVMFLCAAATVSAYMITLAQLPDEIAAMLGPLAQDPAADGRHHAADDRRRHGAGPDPDHSDPRSGSGADRDQGRHRSGVFRRDVRADRFHRADHPAGRHRAQRGRRHRPAAHGNPGARRDAVLPRLPGDRRAAHSRALDHHRTLAWLR